MVDDPAGHLATVDRFERGDVVVVDLRVGLHALQPLLGDLRAFELEQRGHDRLEVGLGRRRSPPALPLGLLQVQHRGRQLLRGEHVGVVGEHGGAGGDTGPLVAGRPVLGRYLRDDLGADVGEEAGPLDGGHGGGVLGEEHVCRRGVPLGHQLVAHLGVAALPVGHRDAGLGGERLDPLLGQRLVLSAVDEQFVALARARASSGAQCCGEGDDCGDPTPTCAHAGAFLSRAILRRFSDPSLTGHRTRGTKVLFT